MAQEREQLRVVPTWLAPVAARRRIRSDGDTAFRGISMLATLCVLLAAVLIAVTVTVSAAPTLGRYGIGFLTGSRWDLIVRHLYGAGPFIFGTILTSLVALLLAGPVGVGVALLVVETRLPRRPAAVLSFLVELLAAIPSIVYGAWGIFVLVPIMQQYVDPSLQRLLGWTPFFGADTGGGRRLLTASLVLAIMIVPTVTAIAREVIRTVPAGQREAMLALGATRWEMIRGAVLPAARSGIIGALILGLGRAMGETIAATMVIGNSYYAGFNLLSGGNTLASYIASNFGDAGTDPQGLAISALFGLGLILLVASVCLNGAARILVWTFARRTSQVL